MVAVSSSDFQDGQTQSNRLMNKIKENPMVPLGFAGMLSMVGYGIYNFRHRGSMSPSVYLMHLRVKAQSMVVGAMTIGISYTLIRDYMNKKDKS